MLVSGIAQSAQNLALSRLASRSNSSCFRNVVIVVVVVVVAVFVEVAIEDVFLWNFINKGYKYMIKARVCLFDLILYVPSTIFQLNRDGSSWVELVLS